MAAELRLHTIHPLLDKGYVYDVETGFYYLRSRYYCSIWNRFFNADNLIQENIFAYCNSNPVLLSDKTGYSSNWDDEEDISLDDLHLYSSTNYIPTSTLPYSSLLEGNYYIITPLKSTAAVHQTIDCRGKIVTTAYRMNKIETGKIMKYVGIYTGKGFYLFCDNAVGYSDKNAWDVIGFSDEAHFMLGVEDLRYNLKHSHTATKYVENLQRQLCFEGFPVEITGVMNEETYLAVQSFQSSRKMSLRDGVVGNSTKEMLFPVCTQ